MRTLEQLEELFTTDLASNWQNISNQEFDPSQKLKIAAAYLNIDLARYNEIFSENKAQFLRYKYLFVFVELRTNNKQSFNDELVKEILQHAQQIIEDNAKLHVKKPLSKFSLGVTDLFIRGKNIKDEVCKNSTLTPASSIINVGPKTAGIEPGYEAEFYQDIVLNLDNFCQGNLDSILAIIDDCQGSLANINKRYLQHLSVTRLVKMDYQKVENSERVSITPEDAQRTSTWKEWGSSNHFFGRMIANIVVYQKEALPVDINKATVSEVVACDIIGMLIPTSQQKILLSIYPNTSPAELKLLIETKKIKNVTNFGYEEPGNIAGSVAFKGKRNLKHRVRQGYNHCLISDPRIKNKTNLYIAGIIGADSDMVGSHGSNALIQLTSMDYFTGVKCFTLIAVDFGHAFAQTAVPELLMDGRLKYPAHYPNFSCLRDISLRSFMGVIHLLAKISGTASTDEIIASFEDPEFTQQINELKPKEYAKIIKDYQTSFASLEQIYQEKEFGDLKVFLKQFENKVTVNLEKIVDQFKGYLAMPAPVVDLIDSLNKLMAAFERKTSLFTENNYIALEYIRITDTNFNPQWLFKEDNDFYYLYFNDLGKYFSRIKKFIKNDLLTINNGSLAVAKKDLQTVLECLTEEKIKQNFHAQDYQYIKTAQCALNLLDLTQAGWFSDNGIELELTFTHEFVLKIASKNLDYNIDPLFLLFCKKAFPEQSITLAKNNRKEPCKDAIRKKSYRKFTINGSNQFHTEQAQTYKIIRLNFNEESVENYLTQLLTVQKHFESYQQLRKLLTSAGLQLKIEVLANSFKLNIENALSENTSYFLTELQDYIDLHGAHSEASQIIAELLSKCEKIMAPARQDLQPSYRPH